MRPSVRVSETGPDSLILCLLALLLKGTVETFARLALEPMLTWSPPADVAEDVCEVLGSPESQEGAAVGVARAMRASTLLGTWEQQQTSDAQRASSLSLSVPHEP